MFICFQQANSPENVPPVIAAPHHYLISIYRNDLFFLAVVQSEGTLYMYEGNKSMFNLSLNTLTMRNAFLSL